VLRPQGFDNFLAIAKVRLLQPLDSISQIDPFHFGGAV
jgi:hypothetical protein